MSEIQDAVQIIRVGYEGIEIAMKIGSGTLASTKKILQVFVGMLEHEKLTGKTSMKKLIQRGGDLQVFQFDEKDFKKFSKAAKKYGILYSVLPDLNKEDGLKEIVFHSEATPRINSLSKRIKFGSIKSMEDYLMNGNEEQLGKLMNFFQKEKLENQKIHTEEAVKADEVFDNLIEKVGTFAIEKKQVSVELVMENFSLDKNQAEKLLKKLETIGVLSKQNENGIRKSIMNQDAFLSRLKNYQSVTDRIRAVSLQNRENLNDITISTTMIVEENDRAIKTRIPGGNGDCIWINKDNVMMIHDGKTLLTFLDQDKDYKIYSADNRVVKTQKGEEIYHNHYDAVEREVRDRYEKLERAERQKAINKELRQKQAIEKVAKERKR